jgi:DNA polymerase III epsilon subunit-like protein
VDEIIEVAAIRVNRDSDRHSSFQSLVKPVERVPKKITQITGITQAMVDNDGLPLSEVLVQLKEFIEDLPIVTFNAAFDMGFIWRAAKRHGVPMNNRYACALKIARRAYPGLPSYRLVDLAKMGNLSDENTHRALGDCKRTVPIFMASVMKIGDRIVWEVPTVDWRVSVQYHKERDANRAFIAETRALEASDPELAVTRYCTAMARMYEYESLIHNWFGDDQILDRLTLVLGKLGRYEVLINSVDSFMARFPEARSNIMIGVLKRKHRAVSKLESQTSHPAQ